MGFPADISARMRSGAVPIVSRSSADGAVTIKLPCESQVQTWEASDRTVRQSSPLRGAVCPFFLFLFFSYICIVENSTVDTKVSQETGG